MIVVSAVGIVAGVVAAAGVVVVVVVVAVIVVDGVVNVFVLCVCVRVCVCVCVRRLYVYVLFGLCTCTGVVRSSFRRRAPLRCRCAGSGGALHAELAWRAWCVALRQLLRCAQGGGRPTR